MLARKEFYERRSKELFQDLGLNNPEYERQYERKRALEKAIAELVGIPISTGILKVARIEKTNDKQDYKVIFQKGAPSPASLEGELATEEGTGDVVINDYSKQKDPAVVQAEELVLHFHKLFHGVAEHQPQSKEIAQAIALITQHGLDTARHVIDFTRVTAESTNFKIQHFGAVLSYTSRAIADLERQERAREERDRSLEHQAEQVRQEQQKHELGERRLAALTLEQYQTRFEQAKELMVQESPMMARVLVGRETSALHEGAIRFRMIKQLDQEEMSLTVQSDTTPTSQN